MAPSPAQARHLSIAALLTLNGFLGLATWVVGPFFSSYGLERALKWLLISNGIESVAGAAMAALNPAWMLSSSGLLAYVLWNLLIVVILILAMARLPVWKQAIPEKNYK